MLVGTFLAFPGAAAIATFVMILAAAYLLFMYRRIVFGEVSAFLEGLGHHLTDITPIEILTLAPLGVLVVVFGIQPGLLLNLVLGPSPTRWPRGAAGGADRDPDRARSSSCRSSC